jgi:hypothetical protein
MNVETILAEVLADRERHTPDPDEVLRRVSARTARRVPHRLVVALAAVVVLVLAAAVAAVVLQRRSEPPADPGEPVRPVQEVRSDLRFGWLPDDLAAAASREFGTQGDGPPAKQPYLISSVYAVDEAPVLGEPGWQSFEVGGRPGRIVSRPTRSIADWRLPSGRWAHLEVGYTDHLEPGNRQPGVENDLRRMAASATETEPTTTTARFALPYLPPGCVVVSVGRGTYDVEDDTVEISRIPPDAERVDTTQDGIVDDLWSQQRSMFGVLTVIWTPGTDGFDRTGAGLVREAPVQGLAAWHDSSGLRLLVPGFHGGILELRRLTDRVTGPELHKVAEGLRWTGP